MAVKVKRPTNETYGVTCRQQQIVLNNAKIQQMIADPSNKWRECQRKQYSVFAIQPIAGIVFANRLEQPESYQYMRRKIGSVISFTGNLDADDVAQLKKGGCYVTDGNMVVLCGTRGEMWTVKPEKLVQSYTMMDGSRITGLRENRWTEVRRAAESVPNAMGLRIPVQYMAQYQTSWGALLTMNNPLSSGHYKGDILVVSKDGRSISPTNNEVFAMTYNLTVGGWSQSGLIAPIGKIKQLTSEQVNRQFQMWSAE